MILTNRFLMDEEDEPKADKREENGPGFLNKKMEQIFFEKRAIYGVRWMINLQRIL